MEMCVVYFASVFIVTSDNGASLKEDELLDSDLDEGNGPRKVCSLLWHPLEQRLEMGSAESHKVSITAWGGQHDQVCYLFLHTRPADFTVG